MKAMKIKTIFLTLLVLSAFWGVGPAVAQQFPAASPLQRAQQTLDSAAGNTGLAKDIEVPLGAVIKGVLALVGTIFFLLTVYAGVLWMTAQGKEEHIEKAQKIITAAVIGLFITLAAYAITTFVTGRLAGGGGGATPGAPAQPPQIKPICADNITAKGTPALCKPNGQCALSIGGKLDCPFNSVCCGD